MAAIHRLAAAGGMTESAHLRDLKAKRRRASNLVVSMEDGKVIAADDKARYLATQREIDELDALIAAEEARDA